MRYGIMAALIVLAMLTGCGTLTSMEELERRAMISGDWSEVEERERILARRKAQSGPKCPDGQLAICETFANAKRCECVSTSVMRTSFAPR